MPWPLSRFDASRAVLVRADALPQDGCMGVGAASSTAVLVCQGRATSDGPRRQTEANRRCGHQSPMHEERHQVAHIYDDLRVPLQAATATVLPPECSAFENGHQCLDDPALSLIHISEPTRRT